MDKKKAKVIYKRGSKRSEGYEEIREVHLGEKGEGKQVGPRVICWPWSYKSTEEADKIVCEIADHNGLDLVNC